MQSAAELKCGRFAELLAGGMVGMGFLSFRLSDEMNLQCLCYPITCWVFTQNQPLSGSPLHPHPAGLRASSHLRKEGLRERR